jgi:hypothetical protein
MGFELIFFTSQPKPVQWKQVVSCLEKSTLFHVVESSRVVNSEISAAYAFEETNRGNNWPEDFYVSLEPQGVYLCFYSSTSQQEKYVANLLADCLLQAGLKGQFEEI